MVAYCINIKLIAGDESATTAHITIKCVMCPSPNGENARSRVTTRKCIEKKRTHYLWHHYFSAASESEAAAAAAFLFCTTSLHQTLRQRGDSAPQQTIIRNVNGLELPCDTNHAPSLRDSICRCSCTQEL